tara:strand:- start:636 stop:767 length:132 start_codon:yes stop_codon:yes gene_type:complete
VIDNEEYREMMKHDKPDHLYTINISNPSLREKQLEKGLRAITS